MQQHPGYQSDFARRYYAEGKAEGKAEGEAEGEVRGEARGKAHAILTLLRGRGLRVSAVIEKRILVTTDLDVLERWLLRAITAGRAQDVVAAD